MDKNCTFPILLPGYTVEGLSLEDANRLQILYEACADYALLEQGELPASYAAELEFMALPPNHTVADKFMFGLVTLEGQIAGLLECNRGYPEEGCWWVGLFMLEPEARGQGVARAFFQAFVAWVATQGAGWLELAVITTNLRACRFWQRQGFEIVRTTPPRAFGRLHHELHVMQYAL